MSESEGSMGGLGGRELPSGTITFLFTDIEGSTRRVAESGDEPWAEVLAAHHALLREAFAAHGGVEVGTQGDAFFVAFERVSNAVSAAVAAQSFLEDHVWPDGRRLRVRMGLHTGEAVVLGGDYVGHEVHRASRICDAGHGGQILLSHATAALVEDQLAEGWSLRDLGLHRLKDLGRPQRLYGLEAPGLSDDFGPLRSLEAAATNLPEQRATFIGRGEEIARLRKLLAGHRLVTATGIGGAGKTRLALQVGADELDEHPDGVFFVDLAAVAEPELVARAVGDAMGLQLAGGGSDRPLSDLLIAGLARRACLLLLDNCEHLLDACAGLVDAILGSCPDVSVLATSREPLDVEGEQVFRVPSLSLADETVDAPSSEAVALFVERAQAADADFEVGEGDAAVVAAICRRLDGIPLAIEFAAARVTHLSIGQLAERLDDRFRLLTGSGRRVRRQQTLEAALDWSYQLLTRPEQALLRRLAVFAGSFGLEAAENVCAGANVDRDEVLDLLASLLAKSLMTASTTQTDVRYRLLETVRSYAEAKLTDAGEAEPYRNRHRDAYLDWLESLSWEELHFDAQVLRALVGELSNLRAALAWSQAQERRDLVGRMAARCMQLWWTEGHNDEGRAWLSWALDEPDTLDRAEQALVHLALSTMQRADITDPSDRHLDQALELGAESLGPLMVNTLGHRAMSGAGVYSFTRDPDHEQQARALAQELIDVAQEHSHPWTLRAWNDHGLSMLMIGDIATAERSFTTVIEESAGRATPELTWAAGQLATCRILLDDPQGALEAAHTATETAPAGLRVWTLNFSASALAAVQLGRTRDAASYLHKALELAPPELPRELNTCLVHVGAIAHELDDPHTASRLLSFALRVGTESSDVVPFQSPAPYALYRHYVPLIRAALDPETARQCRHEGQSMSPEEARNRALEVVDTLENHPTPSAPRSPA